MLVTGRHEPIVGAELIDAALARLHDAVDYVHRQTLAGMNDGKDVLTLMREVRLPAELRVGEGYGTVAWGVRTIWETYMGWFRLRSTTELYPVEPVVGLRRARRPGWLRRRRRAGPGQARRRRAGGGHPSGRSRPAQREPDHRDAVDVMIDAHQALLDGGGDVNFWESGWLRHQRERWRRADWGDAGPARPGRTPTL